MKWRILVPASFVFTFLLALATRQVINYLAETETPIPNQSTPIPTINATLASQRGVPLAIEWSSDNELLLVQTSTGIWGLENTSSPVAPSQLINAAEVSSFAVHPSQHRMIVGYTDGRITLWEYTRTVATLLDETEGELNGVEHIVWSPSGAQILAIDRDQRVILRDAGDLSEISAIEEDGTAPIEVVFNHDGSLILARYVLENKDTGSPLVFYESATGARLEPLETLVEQRAIDQLIYSPDGVWLAAVVSPTKVQLWDAVTLQIAGEFEVGDAGVSELQAVFSPDGRVLIVAQRSSAKSPAARVTQLNVAINRVVDISEYTTTIRDMSLTKDGTQLTLLGDDGLIYRWNRVNETQLPSLSQFYRGE